MSQTEKAGYFRALKAAGIPFDKHYREYTTTELKAAYDKLDEGLKQQAPPDPGPTDGSDYVEDPPPSEFFGLQREAPVAQRDPEEMAGARQNSLPEDEPIRTDENGRVWYQEEVAKPSYPKPRGRRVLKYQDSGVEEQQVKVGDYIETFEVAGRGAPRESEVRITLPSYQVGIFKDPRFPFRVHTYNGREGFDLFEVQNYYGGAELVPAECKRIYIENVLCYDIRTVVRAIETEYRRLQLANRGADL